MSVTCRCGLYLGRQVLGVIWSGVRLDAALRHSDFRSFKSFSVDITITLIFHHPFHSRLKRIWWRKGFASLMGPKLRVVNLSLTCPAGAHTHTAFPNGVRGSGRGSSGTAGSYGRGRPPCANKGKGRATGPGEVMEVDR